MNKHFAYLLDEDRDDFFQKAAQDEASRVVADAMGPVTIEKSAAAPATAFEKVAARVDRDIEMIKVAGDCGVDCGMSVRAGVYLDRLFEEGGLTDEQFGEIFDKVAAEAFDLDLGTAKEQLCAIADESVHESIERELFKLGHEMAKNALLEKEAFLWRALARGAGAKAAVKAAPGAAASAVGRAGRRAAAGTAAAGKATARKYRQARIGLARGKMKGIQSRMAKLKGAPGASAAAQRKYLMAEKAKSGKKLSAFMQRPKYRAAQAASAAKAKAAKAKALKGTAAAPRPPAKPKPIPGTRPPPKSTTAKTVVEKPPKKPKKKEPDVDEGKTLVDEKPAGALAAKKSTTEGVMDTLKKARDQGWKALSSEEKNRLLSAGAATMVGGRIVLGHGLITGGQGLV